MPCGCWPFTSGKLFETNATVIEGRNGQYTGKLEGVKNPDASPEEIITDLNNKLDSLRRVANQLTTDIKVQNIRYDDLYRENQEVEQKLEEERRQKESLERARRALERQLEEKDKENRELREKFRSIQTYADLRPVDKRQKYRRNNEGLFGTTESEGKKEVMRTEKNPEQRRILKEAILQNDLLKRLSEIQVTEMIACVQRTAHQNGVFIKEGTNGDCLYILESGIIEVSQGSTVLTTLTGPAVFGELALLYNCKRTATVIAKKETKVWKLERYIFQQIMRKTADARRRELTTALVKVPLMKKLSRSSISKLTEVLVEESFNKGNYIIRQGEIGETFYIIMQGEVDITEKKPGSTKETFIRTLEKGSYFGEQALLRDKAGGKRGANVVAKSNTVLCMTLEKGHFKALIGERADKVWDVPAAKPQSGQRVLSVNYPSTTNSNLSGQKSAVHRASYDPLAAKESRANSMIAMPPRRMPSVFMDITLHDFEFVGVLGVGGFGRVELVSWKKDSSRTFALKCMKKSHIVETKQEEHIFSEKRIMRDSESPFIVQLYRTFRNDKFVYMLMEACLGGELWAKLRDDGYFSESRTRFYTACVVEAIEYLHLRGIVYRDLKPENLLLDSRGYVKIVDFGFAKSIKHGEKTWTFCGTPEYVAPEVILNKGHDTAVDYWALGILIFEMLTGNPPFNSSDAMKTYRLALRGIDALEWPQKLNKSSAMNLIRRLCRENPSERIGNLKDGVNEIKNHRWFYGFDWTALVNGTFNVPYVPEINGAKDMRNFDRFEREDEEVDVEMSGWDKDF